MLKARAPQARGWTSDRARAADGKAKPEKLLGALGTSAARAIGSQVGREIIRGVLGSIFGSTTTRRRR